MKGRTIIIAGSFAQVGTFMLAAAMTVAAIAYGLGAVMCCVHSEFED